MRPWIEYIIMNPSAHADFLAWTAEQAHDLANDAHIHLLRDETAQAKSAAAKRELLLEIKKKVENERRELSSQLEYDKLLVERS